MILVVLVIVCLMVFVAWSWVKTQPPSPPSYPGALPLIGHAHLLLGDLIHFWNVIKRLFDYTLANGGVIQFKAGPKTLYIITDLEDGMLLANSCLEKPYYYEFAKDLYGNGLLTVTLSKWKIHRKLLNPLFNQQELYTYTDKFNILSRDLVSQLDSEVGKKSINLRHHMITFLMKSISGITLGLKAEEQSEINAVYAQATEEIVDIFVERGLKIWLHIPFIFNWSSLKRKQDKIIKMMNDIMSPVIQKRKLELQAKKESYNKLDNGSSMPDKFKSQLDILLELQENQDAFTDKEIREHLDTLVLGTFDTMASTLTFILLFIGSYAQVQERVYKELLDVVGDEDKDLTKYDITKLVYLEAVIKETLRLYPAVPAVVRKIPMDIKLRHYTLPAGAICCISLYSINRHPMWGADADQFRPERWLDPTTLPNNPNAFASFSLGKRNCIGKVYAIIAMKTALAHIIRRYHITADIDNVVTLLDIIMKPVPGYNINLKIRK